MKYIKIRLNCRKNFIVHNGNFQIGTEVLNGDSLQVTTDNQGILKEVNLLGVDKSIVPYKGTLTLLEICESELLFLMLDGTLCRAGMVMKY